MSARTRWALVAAVVLPLVVTGLDLAGGRAPFDEGLPTLTPAGAGRSLLLAVASFLLVRGLVDALQERLPTGRPRWAVGAVGVATGLGLLTAVAVAVDPQWFWARGQEDGVVENLTAVLFAGDGLLLLLLAVPRLVAAGRVAAIGLAGLWLFSAGEEISWGQRLLGFDGPEALTGSNLQGESNLHNLATDPIEAAFYAGFTLLFVLLPFVVERMDTSRPAALAQAAPVVPRSWLLPVAAPAVGMNVDMWDVAVVQLTVWTTLAVLIAEARARRDEDTTPLLVGIVALVVVQAAALATADRAVALHDITEFKELALGLVVAVHGLDVWRGGAISRRASPSGR